MIKQILVCDRCGAETQIAYRIKAFPISADDTSEGTAQHLGENTDYCPACLRTIATLADTAPLPMILVPDEEEPARDVSVEPSEPEEAPEQVEVEHIITEEPDEAPGTVQSAEKPAEEENPTKPAKKKQYRAKTLYLMKQMSKSVDEIAEETGYSVQTVYKKLKTFKKEGGLC